MDNLVWVGIPLFRIPWDKLPRVTSGELEKMLRTPKKLADTPGGPIEISAVCDSRGDVLGLGYVLSRSSRSKSEYHRPSVDRFFSELAPSDIDRLRGVAGLVLRTLTEMQLWEAGIFAESV